MALPVKSQDGRKKRASLRRKNRRDQILFAARKVFSLKGYHACSIADILHNAGIARGTFYLYFPSKRAIFEILLDEMVSQITQAVKRIKTDQGSEPPLVQMYGNVRRIIEVLETNRELTIILLREAVGLDADFDQKLTLFYEHLAKMIRGAIELGQSMGLVRVCDSRLVSFCVLGSLKEVMLHLLTSEEALDIDRDQVAQEILEYNLLGLFAGEKKGLEFDCQGLNIRKLI